MNPRGLSNDELDEFLEMHKSGREAVRAHRGTKEKVGEAKENKNSISRVQFAIMKEIQESYPNSLVETAEDESDRPGIYVSAFSSRQIEQFCDQYRLTQNHSDDRAYIHLEL